MTYNKFGMTNNAICVLSLEVDESSMVLTAIGNYNRFPTANFIVTVTQRDTDGAIVAMENMLITSRSGAIFTVGTRAYEEVPIDDDATSNIQQALPFDPLVTTIEAAVSTKFLTDIQDEITRINTTELPLKLNVSDYLNGTKVYAATSVGTDAYAITLSTPIGSYQNGMTFRFLTDVGNTGGATLAVSGLTAYPIYKLRDQALATGDLEANQIVTVSFYNNTWQMDSQVATIPTIDINGQTEKTTFDLDDEIIIYDVDGTANKKEKMRTIFGQSFVAGEDIAIDDAVYVSISDAKAYRTDGTSTSKIQVVGFALNTAASGATVYVWFSPKIESGNIGAQSTNTNNTTYNSVDSGTNSFGYKITTTKACSIISVTKSASCTATRAQVLDSGGTPLGSATFSGNVATFASPIALANATVYRVECDKSGASYSWHTKSGSTFNSSTDFNYNAGSNNGGDSNGPSGQTMNTYGFSIASILTVAYSTTKVPGTPYFLSDLPGKIAATAGTYHCKVGIALTAAILAFQPQVKDTYI